MQVHKCLDYSWFMTPKMILVELTSMDTSLLRTQEIMLLGSPGGVRNNDFDWTNCHYVVADLPFAQGYASSIDLASNILPRPVRLSAGGGRDTYTTNVFLERSELNGIRTEGHLYTFTTPNLVLTSNHDNRAPRLSTKNKPQGRWGAMPHLPIKFIPP